jgi:pimeloyl-ACP methyl ester carboxylesterase
MRTVFSRLGPLFPRFFGNRAYNLWITTHRFKRPVIENKAAQLAEKSLIDVNGKATVVWSWGDGKPVLFIHGWSGRGTQAAHFLTPLINSGYRIISFDGPAHGETHGNRTSIPEISDVVLALGKKYGVFHSTITHSFGAMILGYASTLGFNTRSAVCICPPATIQSILDNFQSSLNIPDSVLREMKNRLHKNYGDNLEKRISTLNNVRELSIPALIIHDDKDADIPWQDGKALAEAWQGSKFILTHGLGHRRILRDPTTIMNTTDFIMST